MKRLFSALLFTMFCLGSLTAFASGGDPAPQPTPGPEDSVTTDTNF
jgi:hypothetical protein